LTRDKPSFCFCMRCRNHNDPPTTTTMDTKPDIFTTVLPFVVDHLIHDQKGTRSPLLYHGLRVISTIFHPYAGRKLMNFSVEAGTHIHSCCSSSLSSHQFKVRSSSLRSDLVVAPKPPTKPRTKISLQGRPALSR
jgi:hypothetical protein